MDNLITAARAAHDALDAACGAFSAAEPYLPNGCNAEFTFYASWEDVKGALDKLRDAIAAAEAQPGAEYKRGYEEALNDCIRNGVPWARSMFANDAEHIKSAAEAQPLTITVQEAWEAAGGNPGITPTKGDLIHTLQTMDAAVDEAAEIRRTLAAAPPQVPQPLSDYSIENLWLMRTDIHDGDLLLQLRDFARAVERAHGIKP